MNHFDLVDGKLWCEEVPLERIAEEVGTPTYVYSTATLTRHFNVFDQALSAVDHLICYSVKACSNIAILRLLHNLGAGFDIVSGGELQRLKAAGIGGDKVVFSGVGKTAEELRMALETDIHCFNVESRPELELLSAEAKALGVTARVSIRVNPDVDAQTHPYISTGLKGNKFGVPWHRAEAAYALAATLPNIEIVGADCHIGSQLLRLDPLLDALDMMLGLVDRLRAAGHPITHLDMGGGLGIPYRDESPPTPAAFGKAFARRTAGRGLTLVFEPGRIIAGNAGVLLTRVLWEKTMSGKRFVVVDAAMNDAIRPTLYSAYHEIQPVIARSAGAVRRPADVVGPICESGDFLARDRLLPAFGMGELLAMMSAGAYGFAMSSNYNSRRRAAEVLVDGDRYHVVRRRETWDDLYAHERVPDDLLPGQ